MSSDSQKNIRNFTAHDTFEEVALFNRMSRSLLVMSLNNGAKSAPGFRSVVF
ncbi:hypothetical protein [Sneathiella chinensis]|uniref:Uncharacterized protein n=1 Tax=Sneathiella chinensis TaxID=349750 RepID=A0ABQ5TZ07_9PROT|nr:hypothetical protein [Sneathiella chinensis]GLQ04829.1 hypothetical protein GCM10007924_00500 [Sneathiella chinensis]